MDTKALATMLAQDPEWSGLSAYERTKRCCATYMQAGERLPGWTTIREVIGKGSSGDINRGKTDALADQADQIRNFSGHVAGLPAALAPHVRAFWAASIETAKDAFAQLEAAARAEVDSALRERDAAQAARDASVRRMEELAAELQGVREALVVANNAVAAERAAREQVERAFATTSAGLSEQRAQLQDALEHARKEVHGAVDRLEGVERHALMEVERVKAEAQQSIDGLQSRLDRITAERRVEQARWSTQLRELQASLAHMERASELLQHDNTSLNCQLTDARDQNAKLLAIAGRNDSYIARSRREPLRPRRR